MARYDYKCPSCGTRFEVEHPMSAHPSVSCPKCGSKNASDAAFCSKCGNKLGE